jgi:hypothetical protein
MLLVTSEAERPSGHHVWGTGGWVPPERREALDWLTLARLLGWDVAVESVRGFPRADESLGGSSTVVLACDPASLGADVCGLLASRLRSRRLLIVTRAEGPGGSLASVAGTTLTSQRAQGQTLAWVGPGPARRWDARRSVEMTAVSVSDAAEAWATLDGVPVVAGRRVGQGVIASLGFHPSISRDVDATVTALLRHLLIWGPPGPTAWYDLEGTLVLRMDDPGGAQNVFSRNWSHTKLGEAEWRTVAHSLARRDARLSIAYVAGWVDDGDPRRGTLEVGGRPCERVPGRVHPSPDVTYLDRSGHAPGTLHDYGAEFRGIQTLRMAGLADVELHGYTHMHPDGISWAQASDRYEAVSWYRELGRPAATVIAARPADHHPLALATGEFERIFATRPTTLISPGDQWTDAALGVALRLGISLVSSYYLAIRDRNQFCWATHVCAPYLDKAHPAWFDGDLPVVGYFHDRDLAVAGVSWLDEWLERWSNAGARRMIDFRELTACLDRRLSLEETSGGLRLRVSSEACLPLVRPVTVCFRTIDASVPTTIAMGDDALAATVERLNDRTGRVRLVAPL